MYFDYETGIVVLVQAAIAGGCAWVAVRLSERIKSPILRALLTWPFYALAFIFLASVAVTIYWNMFGPIVLWIGSFIFSNLK
jgi:hypothetical protein